MNEEEIIDSGTNEKLGSINPEELQNPLNPVETEETMDKKFERISGAIEELFERGKQHSEVYTNGASGGSSEVTRETDEMLGFQDSTGAVYRIIREKTDPPAYIKIQKEREEESDSGKVNKKIDIFFSGVGQHHAVYEESTRGEQRKIRELSPEQAETAMETVFGKIREEIEKAEDSKTVPSERVDEFIES